MLYGSLLFTRRFFLTVNGVSIMMTVTAQNLLMKKYGILCKQITSYCYKNSHFNNFQDALNTAALDQDVPKEQSNDPNK